MKTLINFNRNHIAPVNKTNILVSCFNVLSNAFRDTKTKMLNFNTKMAVKVTKGQICTGTISKI